MKSKYPIGYVACVFYDGVKTKYRYAGNGEWEFLSGINSPYMYECLLEMVG
ncbi:hypothetical protein [Pseudoalteromonas phage PH357]|nr:hypothetical protein [Pseudoalteromonas phage PH357]